VKDYVLTLLVAAAATYILTPLVRRLAARFGAMKQPRERDVHVVPVATLGGLAMYGGLAAGLLVSEQIPQLRDAAFTNTGILNGLLLAGGLLVIVGIIDDRWGMGALTKAAGQIAAGGILVATGTTLSWLPLPGGNTYIPDTDQRILLTILIVVATINAVNFIDGLDGLASGIVGIAAVSFFIYYYLLAKVIHASALAAPALASAILIGLCIGFLPHNFSPATIFMGDTGSMLLGLLLAYAPISSINSLPEANLTSQINRYPVILPLILPAALLIIPYADLLLAVVRRTRAGRSPFAPDRKHLHHRLLDIGHSQRTSVLIMYLWAALFSGSVVWLSVEKTVQPRNAGHHGEPIFVFVLITVAAVGALLLMSMPRLRWWQRTRVASDDASAGAGLAVAGGLALASAGAAGMPQPSEAAADRRLAAVSASEVTPSLGTQVESLAAQLPAETMRPEELLTAPVPADPELAEPARNGEVHSLAFWRQAEPQGLAPDVRRPSSPRQIPGRASPGRPAPARSSPVWPGDRLPDYRVTGPARSIIGMVPPAVPGVAPGMPELRPSAGGSEHSDTGSRPAEPEFP
jgi:UDP-GlcNAc:undecaprenyl-phosphate/decaprenyl-phosphate GlcNAc-1-phosphate transferase